MKLVDANVLVGAVNEASTQHRAARRWLDSALSGLEAIGFTWATLLAFLRVSTHASVFARPLLVTDAVEIAQAWLAQPPALVLSPTARHLELVAGLLREAGTGGNLVNDAHLAALALEYDATVVSFDRDFQRFAGVRLEVPWAAAMGGAPGRTRDVRM